MGDVTHARHGPQVTSGVASLAAGHSGIRPQQRLAVGRLDNTRQSCTEPSGRVPPSSEA